MSPRVLVICLLLCALTRAKITHRHISADDRDHFLVELPFGFDERGVIEIEVRNIVAYGESEKSTLDKKKFGFFLASAQTETQVATDYAAGKCYLEDRQLIKLLDFEKWDPQTQKTIRTKLEFDGNPALTPGEYALYYAACDESTGLSFDVRIVFYSFDQYGEKDYLSVGERPLPTIYMVENSTRIQI